MNRSPSRAKSYWRAAAVAAVGLAVAVAILVEARARTDLEDSRDAARTAAHAVLPVARALEDQRDAASLGTDPAAHDVTVSDPDGPSTAVAALARDTGESVLDDVQGGLVVIARYDPPGPTTVATRRASLVGYSVTPLDLDSTLDSMRRDAGSVAVFGPSYPVAVNDGSQGGGSDGHFVVTFVRDDGSPYDVPLDESIAPGWRLQVSVGQSPLPASAWLAALLALIAGLLGAGVTARRATLERRLRDDSRRREQTDATLAELASIAQSSLDLAEVLPASFALLESALELDGLVLLGSGARPTFVWCDAPDELEPAQAPHAPIPAGGCVEVPLARGGRSLGVLRVRPRRELDEVDVRTLVAAAETLSSAIANADAYAHQRSMITRMRSLDNLKTVFVATASHELRTPVAAVVGYASMLTENWDSLDPETGLLYAQRVENNAQRLGALVENLLDFARLEQGRTYTGEKEQLDLGTEVQSIIEGQPDLAPDHELLVAVEPGLVVAGSKLAIERVLTNLVGNAAKYSPAGTTIRVRVEGGDAAHLFVDDEGPGIPPHEREQIFSRFFRGAGDAVTRTRGAGLGLSIVTEFATLMDGAVSIGTAPGGGTRFEVTYPLHEPEAVGPLPNQGRDR